MVTNEQKLFECFQDALAVKDANVVEKMTYGGTAEWDSVGHVTLVAKIEERFGITLVPEDIYEMNSWSRIKSILSKYGIHFE